MFLYTQYWLHTLRLSTLAFWVIKKSKRWIWLTASDFLELTRRCCYCDFFGDRSRAVNIWYWDIVSLTFTPPEPQTSSIEIKHLKDLNLKNKSVVESWWLSLCIVSEVWKINTTGVSFFSYNLIQLTPLLCFQYNIFSSCNLLHKELSF